MASTTTTPPPDVQAIPARKRDQSRLPTAQRMRENITGWLFISPAVLLIGIFGIFPIGYAFYMSLHNWRLRKGDFFCMDDGFSFAGCLTNYTEVVGSWTGAGLFVFGICVMVAAYWVWAGDKTVFTRPFGDLSLRHQLNRALTPVLLLAGGILFCGLAWRTFSAETPDVVSALLQALGGVIAFGVAGWLLIRAHRSGIAKLPRNLQAPDYLLRAVLAFLILGVGIYWMSYGYGLMLAEGNEEFISGLTVTFYYAFGSVPLQLGFGLLLAYVLYKNIRGKQFFRMIFFLPYVTPQVAAAVVFKIVFNPRDGLANNALTSVGLEPQRWTNEADPFLNAFFGWNLEGFIAGPSMALVTIIILGVWTYTGYNAVIFLAGLGSIPEDLYEAARVDGANEWHLFRHITLPLISPITFYLSILAFIGTFKAFNTIFVMRTPFARGTVDTASLVVFDTFQKDFQFGLATAQAILLFFIILGLTQVQRTFFERKVFYG